MPKQNPNQKWDQLLYAAKQGRLPFEREGWLNLAFYLSQQYVEWHQTKGQEGFLRAIPREKGHENDPRPVINKIMHFIRTAQADALQDRPTGDVLPPTSDYMDRSDAKVAKAWIEDQADATKTDYDAKLERATDWALVTGNGYLKWVRGKNGPVIVPPSFFSIYLDPYAKMFSDCRYIIESQFMDTEQVYDLYGKEVPSSGVSSADEVRTELLRGMGAAPALNGVVVNEAWMRPSRRHPRGVYRVWTGREVLVEQDELPYPHLIEHDMLPYTQLGVIMRPDSPYYLSPVQFLRPAQMELNLFHAQLLMNRKNFANGKWWIDAALQLKQMPDDSPGQVLEGQASVPGVKPELIQGLPFPQNGDGEWIEQGMMHIVGLREVSNAQVPGRVEAAKAIELLKEADADALAVLRRTIKTSNDQGWFHQLQLARTYQKSADIVTTYSREGLPEVQHFMAGKMAPGHRVRTSMTTGLARSRTNKQDLLVRLWDSKVITDPEYMSRELEMPLPSTASHDADDIMLARNENLELAGGDAIEPNSWDNHPAHLREHNAYRKTSDYRTASKEVKERFEHHCTRHDSLMEIQLARQAQLQMIMQGAAQQPQNQPPAATPAEPTTQEA